MKSLGKKPVRIISGSTNIPGAAPNKPRIRIEQRVVYWDKKRQRHAINWLKGKRTVQPVPGVSAQFEIDVTPIPVRKAKLA